MAVLYDQQYAEILQRQQGKARAEMTDALEQLTDLQRQSPNPGRGVMIGVMQACLQKTD